ncbi:MAG: 1-aminocyclopropane-1-carboxylate deaminase [Gammaproteobacteria bacterium]|nr:MAG: 1-aminocyclopropane-1-carboxylate deaminase [Gammaproteobacteria bacterium]
MLRLDLMHPTVSGNKWFKLRDNLIRAKQLNKQWVVSFGGAFSNHIHALAAAGQQFGFRTMGFIRGEPEYIENPTLSDAAAWGMELRFLSREEYRQKESESFANELEQQLSDFYLIPEGGGNALGVKGCQKILKDLAHRIDRFPDYVACDIGTGSTFAGLISSDWPSHFLGFAALKGAQSLAQQVRSALVLQGFQREDNWEVISGYHFGGFARVNKPLIQFMHDYKAQTGIALELIYSAKLLFGLHDLISKERFQAGDEILLVHGGGMQGLRGMEGAMARYHDT